MPRVGPAALVAVLTAALAAGAAPPATAACPKTASPSYTDECGPSFVLPGWGDAGGWTDPEHYTTIQLADVDGDGRDELLARTPGGLAVQVFDTTFGQWRPQVDAQDRPIVLTDFADPPPLTTANPSPPRTDWRLPQYYDTIMAADWDGQKGEEILARNAQGLVIYKFTPGATPGKGSWQLLAQTGYFAGSGWDDPSSYATLQAGDLDGDRSAEVFGRQSDGIVAVNRSGVLPRLGFLGDGDGGNQAAYYTSIQAANVVGDDALELIGRDNGGVSVFRYRSGAWTQVSATHPFSDVGGLSDCPVSAASSNCLGAGAAYYSTLQLADIDGGGQADLVARTSDGVRAYFYDGDRFVPGTARLTDLSDAGGADKEPYYSTLQFADINGDQTAEALARDKNGLQAWSFDGTKWTKLAPSPALTLVDDPWGDTSTAAAGDVSRSYYATIQTGDVDGDKHADVVARGPYGIRTWFYNRRGTGGWEHYLAGGYSAFTGSQENAYARLNSLARRLGYLTAAQQTLRDVWTGDIEPTQDLGTLMTNLADAAGCPRSDDKLPHYLSCTPPADASGFTAADWTAVVNQIVAELFYADQVLDHFNSSVNGVKTVWKNLFLDQQAVLDSLAGKLKLQAAKDTRTTFDVMELFSGMLGLGGALLGAAGGEVAAAVFEIASEVVSMVPSASESLTAEFDAALSGLDDEFATGVSESGHRIDEHGQIIRQDQALLLLVGQLRDKGTWQLNPTGMESVGQQGFALWVYRSLLPTMYARYVISGCKRTPPWLDDCDGPPAGSQGVVGAGPSFASIGPFPSVMSPCYAAEGHTSCQFVALPGDLGGILWGRVSPTCTYDGRTAGAAWVYGCNLGVDPQNSVVASGIATRNWPFQTYAGNPVLSRGATGAAAGVASVGRDRSLLRLSGRVRLPRSFRLGRARVAVHRLLHEAGGEGELADARLRPPLTLSPASRMRKGVRAYSSQRRRRPRVRLRLRRRSRTSVAFTLLARGPRVSLPNACAGIRRGVDLATSPIFLHTLLRIRDGRGRSVPISVRPHWRCRRNRLGAVHRLVVRRPKARTPSRGGLAVTVRGSHRATAGGTAGYTIKVRNRRRTAAYDVLVHGLLPRGLRARRARGSRGSASYRVWRLARLRPGRSRTVRLRVRVGASAAGGKRVTAVAQAIDTRPARDRFRTRIHP